MCVTRSIEKNIVYNEIEKDDTLDDIFEFISENIDEWKSHQVLWDMTLFAFRTISAASTRSLIEKSALISQKRSGRKSAIFINDIV